MIDFRWTSPIKSKGFDGLNNAGINTFNGNIVDSFVREMIQNSNDARNLKMPVDESTGAKPPLKVRMFFTSMNKSEFIGFDEYRLLIEKIRDTPGNNDHKRFFKNVFEEIDGAEIPIFIYQDSNTYGLSGQDDEDTKSFSSCVLSEGTSIKSNKQAGGSFGIGKNAIYGFSKARTVFYSSLNLENERIVQGVAKLASYSESGITHEGRLYFGRGDSSLSIRDEELINTRLPSCLHRNEPGLTQVAIAPYLEEHWEKYFTMSVLNNYWYLISTGDLIVEIGSEHNLIQINDENLEDLLNEYFGINSEGPWKEDFARENPLELYRSMINGKEHPFDVKHLGRCSFHFKEIPDHCPSGILYLRNGMKIETNTEHGFGSINYAGVFKCETDEGNSILRLMEPPEHNQFDEQRLNERHDVLTDKEGRLIKKLIKNEIRKCLTEILDKYRRPAESIQWLDDKLTDLLGMNKMDGTERKNESNSEESPFRIVNPDLNAKVTLGSAQNNTVVTATDAKNLGKGGGNSGAGQGGSSGSGGGTRSGSSSGSGALGKRKSNKANLSIRVFLPKPIPNAGGCHEYIANISSSNPTSTKSADFMLEQVGDSGNCAAFELKKAMVNKQVLSIEHCKNTKGEFIGALIKNVPIPASVILSVKEPSKSNFKLTNA